MTQDRVEERRTWRILTTRYAVGLARHIKMLKVLNIRLTRCPKYSNKKILSQREYGIYERIKITKRSSEVNSLHFPRLFASIGWDLSLGCFIIHIHTETQAFSQRSKRASQPAKWYLKGGRQKTPFSQTAKCMQQPILLLGRLLNIDLLMKMTDELTLNQLK